MKRTNTAALAAFMVFAFLLSGCATSLTSNPTGSGPKSDSVDITSTAYVNSLCGDEAKKTLEDVKAALDAEPNSGKRNALKDYGISDPKTANLTEIVAALEHRANTECKDVVVAGNEDGTVGIDNIDGTTVANLPVVTGTDATLIVDSTTQPATRPLLDGSLRFTAQTLTWAGLVERVGDQQWYIDGVNARAAQTGFTWDDILRFASANRMVDGKVEGVNALAIQVFNRPDLTVEQARAEVSAYITPEVEKQLNITLNDTVVDGVTVPGIPVQYINNGFVNTRNVGSADAPQMGDYFDSQAMVRVSLMPITFDANGAATSLDGSRGAGIFMDCLNLHWVPVAVWKCKDASCFKPKCPPGMLGTPPNCTFPPRPTPRPPSGCQRDCDQPPGLTPKGNRTPSNEWTPLQVGPLTDGRETTRQRQSGEVRGQVTDDVVPEGTKSGDTTPDHKPGAVTAPGGSPGGDDRSNDVVDETVTNQDDGGTSGDTCIADPDTGISNCG